MGTNSTIEWTDATWNPVRGCSMAKGSELGGCLHCYAARQAARNLPAMRSLVTGEPFAILTSSGPRWTGEVRLIEAKLDEPLRWKKPRRVFVNSMSDLFHERLPLGAIDKIFAVMSQSPEHTFQILTKRPARMIAYVTSEETPDRVDEAGGFFGWCHANVAGRWPLPNVELGVSIENQSTAEARIPLLLRTPARVRFVSYEPALAAVDFGDYLGHHLGCDGMVSSRGCQCGTVGRLDWLIVGGESGPGARPFDLAWARRTVEECKAAGVACFVKQLGARPQYHTCRNPSCTHPDCGYVDMKLTDRKGGNPEEWPADLRVREFPRRGFRENVAP